MKIVRASIYTVDLPTKGGGYRRSIGFAPDGNLSVIVRLDTDEGISGYGEVSPIGTHYGRGWGEAALSGIPLLARMIIGEDPLQIEKLNRMWDVKFKDDQYVKSPVDVALWDIAGKASGRPVCHLLGGHYEGGYFGEVMCTSAKALGLGGLVIDGCVRDGNELAQMGWPVFARGLAMRGTLKDLNGDLYINQRIAIGEAIIEPGDLVVGDTDGVVVIPRAQAAAAIEASIQREANEAETMKLLAKGETTLVKMRGWERG